MADKPETTTVYRCIVRVEMQTDKLTIAAQLVEELDRVAAKFGGRVAENVNLPVTTTSPGRA